MIDESMMHGLIELILELHLIFSDGNIMRRREVGLFEDLPFTDGAE
jgi:hypothetical protein